MALTPTSQNIVNPSFQQYWQDGQVFISPYGDIGEPVFSTSACNFWQDGQSFVAPFSNVSFVQSYSANDTTVQQNWLDGAPFQAPNNTANTVNTTTQQYWFDGMVFMYPYGGGTTPIPPIILKMPMQFIFISTLGIN